MNTNNLKLEIVTPTFLHGADRKETGTSTSAVQILVSLLVARGSIGNRCQPPA